MSTTLISPRDAEILDLAQECVGRYKSIGFADISKLAEAAGAEDQVAAFKALLVGENRRPMVRAIEAGLRCATRGGGRD